jgi:Bacterial regulatory proteins, luxR family
LTRSQRNAAIRADRPRPQAPRQNSADEIAGQLVVSPLTAKTHVSRAMTKLSARDRAARSLASVVSRLPHARVSHPQATVVRLVLVPGVMELLGKANWWLPGWLDRLLPARRAEALSGDEPPAGTPMADPAAAR